MSTPTTSIPPTQGPAHPLDEAVHLHAEDDPAAAQPPLRRYTGQTHLGYWNMVGPFGGITAATLLQAVLQHPGRLGEPVSLTVNYAGALTDGPFTVHAEPVRTNRSTQHWTLSVLQAGADGVPVVTTTATAFTALRRDTWGVSDVVMPAVPRPDASHTLSFPTDKVAWLNRYEMRLVSGNIPSTWDGSGTDSLTQMWVRDAPSRPLDYCALAALADTFYPRVWLRRATPVSAGTVSMTVYFHATADQLKDTGTGFLLGQARAQHFHNGYFDQTAQLWNEAGTLLAASHQVVYYKE
jgi:acyl-CoA thioesterase